MRLMDLFLAWLVTRASKSFGLHDLSDTITIFLLHIEHQYIGGAKKKKTQKTILFIVWVKLINAICNT